MNREREYALRIRRYLDLAASRIDPDTASRLYHARQQALARGRVATGGASLAGGGMVSIEGLWPALRAILAFVALVAAISGAALWNMDRNAAELAEVDTALLADDLPLAAFLDKGFVQWLAESSEE
jgi:hypothetical protein